MVAFQFLLRISKQTVESSVEHQVVQFDHWYSIQKVPEIEFT
jgi:hypothetical protein